MDHARLREWAVRGARLELDELLSRIIDILSEFPELEKEAKEVMKREVDGAAPKRKPLSEEGRQKIAAAQKKRWAERKAAAQTTGGGDGGDVRDVE